MQNRPSKEELLRGVLHFLREEAVQALEGPAKFHARVASRAVEMALRELDTEAADLAEELEGLCRLLNARPGETPTRESQLARVAELNRDLAARIREGQADAAAPDSAGFRAAAIDHLKRMTVRRLAVSNPEMAARVRGEFGFPRADS